MPTSTVLVKICEDLGSESNKLTEKYKCKKVCYPPGGQFKRHSVSLGEYEPDKSSLKN